MANEEFKLLNNWKLKISLLAAIILPTVTATGTFYELKANINEKEQVLNEKINAIELQNQKNFADKSTIEDMRDDIKEIRGEISEVKTLLIKKIR